MAPDSLLTARRLLACVAEGTHSDEALRAAAELSKRTGAELELLHVLPPISPAGVQLPSGTLQSVLDARRAHVAERLRAHVAQQPDLAHLAERLEVAIGLPARVVLERVRDRGHDVVFVGDSGKRKQLDLGGLARALVARLPCPIWLQVRAWRPLTSILVPVDLSPASRDALSRAVSLAQVFGARVTALHCFAAPELFYGTDVGSPVAPMPYTIDALRKNERASFEQFVEGFDWRGVEHEHEFVEDDPARTILARQERFDLIAMGTHGRSALAAAVLGSVTWHVLRHAHSGVFAIREPKAEFAF